MLRILAAAAACGAAAAAAAHPRGGAFQGAVYAIALNGTTNTQQFLVADLETFIVSPVGPSLGADVDVMGSASVVEPSSGLFFATLYYFGPSARAAGHGPAPAGPRARPFPLLSDDRIDLVGLNLATGAVEFSLNTSAWTGDFLFVTGIFLRPATPGVLFVVGEQPKLGYQVFVDVNVATGAFNVLGRLAANSGSDAAFDPATGYLYELLTDGSDDDSGNLTIVDTSASPPAVIGAVQLANFFDLPQWDAKTGALTGLMLSQPTPGDYGRNFTLLYPSADNAFNVSVHGTLGAFFALYDGPKALDPVGRRAFYVIATSAMGEMDLVTVGVDLVGNIILESPGICGFIGYCPGVLAYHLANGHAGSGVGHAGSGVGAGAEK
jgi:hypothetical protein